MALESQLVHVNFAGGMDEKTSDRYVVPGKLISLKNGRFRKVGEISKRYGNVLAATKNETLDMTYAAKLGSFNDEVLVFDKRADGRTTCASLSSKTGQFEHMGYASEAIVLEKDAHFDAANMFQHDIAYSAGVAVMVWSTAAAGTSGDIWYMVRDSVTGTMITKPTAITTATTFRKPRVCFCGSTAIIVYQNNANLVAHTINTTTFALSVGTNVRTNNTAYGDFDISGSTTKWVMVYQKTGGGADLVIDKYDSALALSSSVTSAITPSVGPSTKYPIACHFVENSDIWVFVCDNDAGAALYRPIVTWIDPSSMTETPVPITMANYGGQYITQASIVRHVSNGTEYGAYVFDAHENTTNAANGVVHAGAVSRSGTTLTNSIAYGNRYVPWCSLGSKIFSEGGRAYFFGMLGGFQADTSWLASSHLAPSYSVVLIDPKLSYLDQTVADIVRPVAVAAPRYALLDRVAQNAQPKGPCSVAQNSGKYVTYCRIRTSNGQSFAARYRGTHGLSMFEADFRHQNKFQQATLGEFSCFSGGVPSYYDGRTPAEIGFVHYPEGLTVSFAATGSGSLGLGDYAWMACYVFYDELGNAHRSAFSVPITGNNAAGDQANVVVPSLLNTMRNDAAGGYLPRVGVEVYRTKQGATSGPFYLVQNTPDTMTAGARTITVADSYSDATIAVGLQAYTTGGAIDNVCPPSFIGLVASRGRLFGIDNKRVWFSKILVQGEGPAFADEFTLDVSASGELTAIGTLDDKVIVFAQNSIYVITGRGPDDTTLGNDFEVTQISADRGCVQPRSVINVPMGLMFKSDVGIYILTRGLELQFIGSEVRDKTTAYPFITSANVHPTDSQVYFTCNTQTGGAGNGIRLVYDYDVNQWSYDSLAGRQYGSTTIVDACPILGATIANGRYYWQDGNGYVYYEDTDGAIYYDDGSTYVPIEMQLAPINLNGINGYQRARYLQLKVKNYTSPIVSFDVYADDDVAPSTSASFSPLQTEMRVCLTRQLASTHRVVISDSLTGSLSTGKGAAFVGISFDVGVQRGANRLAAAKTR